MARLLLFVLLISTSVSAQINISLVDSSISCAGPCNGYLTFNVNGGNPPYTYDLQPGSPIGNNGAYTGLCASTYTFVVTDQNNNTAFYITTVPQIQMPSINNVITTPIQAPFNYEATVQYTGGTPPYYVTWLSMPLTQVIRMDTVMILQDTISHLTPGDYRVTVMDSMNVAHNCGIMNSYFNFSICDPNCGVGQIQISPNDTVCSGTQITVTYIMMPFYPNPQNLTPFYSSDNPNCDPSGSGGNYSCIITQTTTFDGGYFYGTNCAPIPFPPSTITVMSCTGINEHDATTLFSIAPDPNNGNFKVRTGSSALCDLKIYDVTGHLCYSQMIADHAEIQTELPDGIYYTMISTGEKVSGQKIVICK